VRLTLFLLIILISSCSKKRTGNENKSVFRYNESSGVTSLDPAFASNQANIWACNQLYNGLVQLDNKLIPQPCIAKNWELSTDGKEYIFHLRNDVFFHANPLLPSGRMVNANDFVYSFTRIVDGKMASPGSWVFNAVKRDSTGQLIGFSALNDSTLKITLENTFPPFLGLLGSAYGAVVPREVVEFYGKDFRKHPIGTGPFKFSRWIERTAIVLHKNHSYFEKDEHGVSLPYLDAIMISFISDKQSAFLEFVKGKLDFLSGLDASYKDDLLTPNGLMRPKYKGRFRMETAPYLNTEYLGFMMDDKLAIVQNSPIINSKIRQAINFGFDRKKMITYLRNGMATPGVAGIVPLGIPGFNTIQNEIYNYNPTKAKQLLAEAGYPNGVGLPQITLSTTSSYQDLCEYMQGQLGEIGIKVELEINQAAQHRQMVAKQQLSWFRASWIADYADAENYLSLFYSKNKAPIGPNYTHYSNPQFDELFDQAMFEQNDSARYSIYRKMDDLLMQDAPIVVLYYDKVLRLSQNNIKGLEINPMNLLSLKRVRKTNLKISN
jgi:peptide/nickel transport system substrate-binding protein